MSHFSDEWSDEQPSNEETQPAFVPLAQVEGPVSSWLFFASNLPEASREIEEHGGQVTHFLSEQVLIAVLPAQVPPQSLTSVQLVPPASLDAASSRAVTAWQQLQAQPPPSAEEAQRSWGAILGGCPPQVPGLLLPPKPYSPFLRRRICVGLCIISGTDAKYAFTNEEQMRIKTALLGATQLLATTAPSAGICFQFSDVDLQVKVDNPCQPTPQLCEHYSFHLQCEAPWRDPALQLLGYASVTDYVKALLQMKAPADQQAVDGACVVFVVKYPLCAIQAYTDLLESYCCIQYRSDQDQQTLKLIMAHEIAHVFGAQDEYNEADRAFACQCESRSGYLQAPNYNCVNCPNFQYSCLMKTLTQEICPWTCWHVGWQPLVWGTLSYLPPPTSLPAPSVLFFYSSPYGQVGFFQLNRNPGYMMSLRMMVTLWFRQNPGYWGNYQLFVPYCTATGSFIASWDRGAAGKVFIRRVKADHSGTENTFVSSKDFYVDAGSFISSYGSPPTTYLLLSNQDGDLAIFQPAQDGTSLVQTWALQRWGLTYADVELIKTLGRTYALFYTGLLVGSPMRIALLDEQGGRPYPIFGSRGGKRYPYAWKLIHYEVKGIVYGLLYQPQSGGQTKLYRLFFNGRAPELLASPTLAGDTIRSYTIEGRTFLLSYHSPSGSLELYEVQADGSFQKTWGPVKRWPKHARVLTFLWRDDSNDPKESGKEHYVAVLTQNTDTADSNGGWMRIDELVPDGKGTLRLWEW